MVVGHVDKRSGILFAGAVDHDVKDGKLVDQRTDCIRVCHVTRANQRLPTCALDLGRDAFQITRRARYQDKLRTGLRKSERDGGADASPSASDERQFAVYPERGQDRRRRQCRHRFLLVRLGFAANQRMTNGSGVSFAVLIQTLLVWRYSRIASIPFSRPTPDRL